MKLQKLQRLRPQDCDSSWSCKLDRENTGGRIARKRCHYCATRRCGQEVLTLLKPEAQHLINIKNNAASRTWEDLANTAKGPNLGVGRFAFEVLCLVCALDVEILFGVSAK